MRAGPTYAARKFKSDIENLFEDAYGKLHENLTADVVSLTHEAVIAPKGEKREGQAQDPWKTLIEVLERYMWYFDAEDVPLTVRQHFFSDTALLLDEKLLNTLLSQSLFKNSICTFSNGEHMRYCLTRLENWFQNQGVQLVGKAFNQLTRFREALFLLNLGRKKQMGMDTIVKEVCPSLAPGQIHRLCSHYRVRGPLGDRLGTMAVLGTEALLCPLLPPGRQVWDGRLF